MPDQRIVLSKLSVGALSLLLLAASCSDKPTSPPPPPTGPQTVEALLAAAPISSWSEIAPPDGSHFSRCFAVEINQPVDHADSAGPRFNQFLYLSHASRTAPTHIKLTGYAARTSYTDELSGYLHANQVYIGHRYVGGYGPEPPVWDHMTAEQASADAHRIIDWLKTYYTGPFISSGASKGGAAAACHRYFYPDDVAATVAYVTPIMLDTTDARFDDFILNQVGDRACRDRLIAFQRAALLRRDSLLPRLQDYVDQQGYTYRYGLAATWEMALMEFPFFFWQFGPNDCGQVPDSTASTQQLFDFMQAMADVDWLAEEYISYFEPVFYQIYTELGYYRLINDHLSDLLVATTAPSYSMFAPEGVPRPYSPQLMQDVAAWLQGEATNFIFIYGEIDPYTAVGVPEPAGTNSITVVEPNQAHRTRIASLTSRRPEVFDSLEAWLGVTVDRDAVIAKTGAKSSGDGTWRQRFEID